MFSVGLGRHLMTGRGPVKATMHVESWCDHCVGLGDRRQICHMEMIQLLSSLR